MAVDVLRDLPKDGVQSVAVGEGCVMVSVGVAGFETSPEGTSGAQWALVVRAAAAAEGSECGVGESVPRNVGM
jgi:hypothetical protein